jgi:tetratricopeptide (TPR) repeat protein
VLKGRGDEEGAAEYYERALKMNAEVLSMPAAEELKPDGEPTLERTAKAVARPASESASRPDRAMQEASRVPVTRDASILTPSEEFTSGSVSVKDRPRPKVSDVNINQILKQFKSQMEDKIGPDDYQCHYDMGMTYKEMGLYEEALNELRVASASDKFRAKAFELAGLCHLEIGEYEEALEAFKRAIKERSREDMDYPGLCFNLGTAFEALGRTKEALNCFQEVESLNPEFPGLKEKLETQQSKIEEER